MSGGSYGYLYHRLESPGEAFDGYLQQMANRVAELAPNSAAAFDFATILELMRALGPVAYAVEWHDSGDTSEADAMAAIKKYAKEQEDGTR